MTYPCPCCGEPAHVGRRDGSAAEFWCWECGQRHTRKDGDPDAYAFFPPDVAGMLDPSIQPMELDDVQSEVTNG